MAEANEFLGSRCWTYVDPGFARALAAAGLDGPGALSSRDFGAPVEDHRSSWVRRADISPFDCHIKVYDYPTLRDRLRGVGRNTALAPSRAARELRALRWLRAHGFDAPLPLGLAEVRAAGLLRRATLVTETWPGRDVPSLLGEFDGADRERLVRAVWRFVERLHAAGFRDRNLDPRNLLARRAEDGSFQVAKIDSPRHAIPRNRTRARRLAREDVARLQRGLLELGVPVTADD